VQAGRDAGDANVRRAAPQLGDEPVAPAPVRDPRPADVPVVGARDEQLGERELVEGAAVPVRERLRRGDLVDEPRGKHEPSQPQATASVRRRGASGTPVGN
jgi:hypothetical protein